MEVGEGLIIYEDLSLSNSSSFGHKGPCEKNPTHTDLK